MTSRGGWRPFAWLTALVAVTAAWMNAGTLHSLQNADSLVPVLVSTQHWTPFYWGQDRFGMLVPLLAMPLQHPLANMLAQGWLTTVAALIAPFLCARFLMPESTCWFAAGALANILVLAIASFELQFDWFVTQPYAVSISLAAGALLALERTGLAGTALAVGLMLLAHWVNLGVCVLLVPAILLRPRVTGRTLSVVAVGFAGGFLLMRASTSSRTTTDMVDVSEWPHAWLQLAHMASSALAHPVLLAVAVAFAAIGGAALCVRARFSPPIEAAATALIVALVYWLAAGTFKWVQLNHYYPRYVFPSLLFAGVALAILMVAPLPGRRSAIATAASATLVVVAFACYGSPSLQRVRSRIDDRFGRMTPEIIVTGATVVVGDYWAVWPSVFHANLALYRQPTHPRVYGLTTRSEATDPLWSGGRPQHVVLAAPPNDRRVEFFTNRINLPVSLLEHRTSLDLFVTRPAAGER